MSITVETARGPVTVSATRDGKGRVLVTIDDDETAHLLAAILSSRGTTMRAISGQIQAVLDEAGTAIPR